MLLSKALAASAPPAIEITYVASATFNGGAVSYSGIDIGPHFQDRAVLFCWSGTTTGSNTTINSCTIGGSAATSVVGTGIAYPGAACMFLSTVPTGSTTNVTISYSDAVVARGAWSVYTLKNYKSLTPVDVDAQQATASSRTVSLTTAVNSIIVGLVATGSGPNNVEFSNSINSKDYQIKTDGFTVHAVGRSALLQITNPSVTINPGTLTALITRLVAWN